MIPRSFQARIALLSACLSGIVVIGFGVVFLGVIHREGLERVDREIRAFGESEVKNRLDARLGEKFEQSLRFIYGEARSGGVVLRMINRVGDVVYESPDWPGGLRDDALPLPSFPAPGSEEDFLPPSEFDGPPGEFPRPGRPGPPGRREGPPVLREPKFVTLAVGGATWRFGVIGHDMATAVVGIDLATLQAENDRYLAAFLIATPMALLLLAACGWLLARRALRPVRLIGDTAARLTARALHERVPVVRSDREFTRLVDVINDMLDRLERSFHQAVRFSADAAHELKTPLTVLQGRLEQAVQESTGGSREQQVFVELLDEVQRLKSITRKLLLLARADAGQLPIAREKIDLSEAVLASCEDARILAPDLAVRAEVPAGVRVEADRDLLNQVLQNLFSNAAKYNRPGGSIEVLLRTTDGRVELAVANTGGAIPERERDRVFERFYRGDASRSREVDGSGLGLSLSREIARAHGGDLTLVRSDSDRTVFRFDLPLPPDGGGNRRA